MNTFFKHKHIDKCTRAMKSKGEKYVIDYALINRPYRKDIEDVRVIRGPKINSDHYFVRVMTTIKEEDANNKKI